MNKIIIVILFLLFIYKIISFITVGALIIGNLNVMCDFLKFQLVNNKSSTHLNFVVYLKCADFYEDFMNSILQLLFQWSEVE